LTRPAAIPGLTVQLRRLRRAIEASLCRIGISRGLCDAKHTVIARWNAGSFTANRGVCRYDRVLGRAARAVEWHGCLNRRSNPVTSCLGVLVLSRRSQMTHSRPNHRTLPKVSRSRHAISSGPGQSKYLYYRHRRGTCSAAHSQSCSTRKKTSYAQEFLMLIRNSSQDAILAARARKYQFPATHCRVIDECRHLDVVICALTGLVIDRKAPRVRLAVLGNYQVVVGAAGDAGHGGDILKAR
jgi:hypothetical protein